MSTLAKSAIRSLLPETLHQTWKLVRFKQEQAQARGKALNDVFSDIYERGLWASDGGPRYQSGAGSFPHVTAAYEGFVAKYITSNPSVSTLVDIGCGDFQVADRILRQLPREISYIGCDIAANVIAHNERTFSKPGRIEFACLNMATDPLPPGDVVTIREVFQHLSNDTIQAALVNLRRRYNVAIVTEAVHVEPASPNLDIVSGYRTRDALRSGVYLDQAPFNLKVLERFETPASEIEVYRTLVIEL